MIYKIKYNYNTGDSFSNEDGLENVLELDWSKLEIAEDNTKRIEEHYDQHSKLNSYEFRRSKESVEDLLEKNMTKDWFVREDILVTYKEGEPDNYFKIDNEPLRPRKGYKTKYIVDRSAAENQLIIYTDDGKPFQFWAPWCGYFESLNYVEVVSYDPKLKKKRK